MNQVTYDEFVRAYEGQGLTLKKGRGQCPCCHRSKNGFSVSEKNGGLLVNCFASGCNFTDILDSVELLRSKNDREYTPSLPRPPPKEKTAEDLEWETAIKKQDEEKILNAPKVLSKIGGEVAYNSHAKLIWYLNSKGIFNTPPTIDMGYLPRYQTGQYSYEALAFLIMDNSGVSISAEIYLMNNKGVCEPGNKRFLDILERSGGHIIITKGTDTRLFLAEGIMTAFSVAEMLFPKVSTVWSCCGSGGLKSIRIPFSYTEIIICADNDPAGINASNELYLRLTAEGRNCRIMMPDEPGHDWNDVLKNEQGIITNE